MTPRWLHLRGIVTMAHPKASGWNIGKSMHRIAAALLFGLSTCLLAGCLSIPISTIYKVARMSDEDLFNMDPAQLRAAIQLPDNVPVDPSKIIIGFCFRKDDKDMVGVGGNWPVQLVNQGRYVTAALPTVKEGQTLYLFRLSDPAQAKLNQILATRRADKKAFSLIAININLSAGDAPTGVDTYRTSGWFQLSKEQGYLQMLDDYKVDAEELRKDAAKSASATPTKVDVKPSGCV